MWNDPSHHRYRSPWDRPNLRLREGPLGHTRCPDRSISSCRATTRFAGAHDARYRRATLVLLRAHCPAHSTRHRAGRWCVETAPVDSCGRRPVGAIRRQDFRTAPPARNCAYLLDEAAALGPSILSLPRHLDHSIRRNTSCVLPGDRRRRLPVSCRAVLARPRRQRGSPESPSELPGVLELRQMAVSPESIWRHGLFHLSPPPGIPGSHELVLANSDLTRSVLVVLLCVPRNAFQHPAGARRVDQRVQKHPTCPRLHLPTDSAADGVSSQFTGEVPQTLL